MSNKRYFIPIVPGILTAAIVAESSHFPPSGDPHPIHRHSNGPDELPRTAYGITTTTPTMIAHTLSIGGNLIGSRRGY